MKKLLRKKNKDSLSLSKADCSCYCGYGKYSFFSDYIKIVRPY
ncbi:hypothetical protein PV797_09695 [Clostridiaceae bacterium M8S5]|nr:hypothetical protein PV797_09695 [Clostridiaceae bacterium M8S5]